MSEPDPSPEPVTGETLYHEITCPSLTKAGPCTCTPVVVDGGGDVLAWLNHEQKQATRWGFSDRGIYRFQLTGPELMRIRRALEHLDSLSRSQREAEQTMRASLIDQVLQIVDESSMRGHRNYVRVLRQRIAALRDHPQTGP